MDVTAVVCKKGLFFLAFFAETGTARRAHKHTKKKRRTSYAGTDHSSHQSLVGSLGYHSTNTARQRPTDCCLLYQQSASCWLHAHSTISAMHTSGTMRVQGPYVRVDYSSCDKYPRVLLVLLYRCSRTAVSVRELRTRYDT